mgnify:FL=1
MRPEAGRGAPVFWAFLRLGLTAFGGPVAHLAYFRTEFVGRRGWVSDARYGELVALCQFLPGPASSQVGMAIGMERAGLRGALAAWLGFTLPSALVLLALAEALARYPGLAQSGAVHGLKIAAVAVVAQAVWSMARSLCPDAPRAALAVLAAAGTLWVPTAGALLAALLVCALLGRWWLHGAAAAAPLPDAQEPPPDRRAERLRRRWAGAALLAFCLPLALLPWWAAHSGEPLAAVLSGVYRAGALVFGGGHVVLPLLEASVVPAGLLTQADFLAGYGAAQAVPGPLFSVAAYLGAFLPGAWHGWPGAALLLCTIFLPGFLVLAAALPFWSALRGRPGLQAALAGVQAGVVGLLLGALYDPVWLGAVHQRSDAALVLVAWALLALARWSPVLIVAACAAVGWALAQA